MTLFYPEDFWDPFNNLGYLIRHAHQLMISRLEIALMEHELTFVQWLVLLQLHTGKAGTAAELCREINYDSGALTRIIENLSQRGLIERHRSSDDRRLVELNLTDEGRSILETLKPVIVNCLNTAVSGLTHDETKSLLRLLTKLIRGVSASPATETALPPLSEALR